MGNNTIRFLSQEDVQRCLTMEQAVDLLKDAFLQLYHKKVLVPQRLHPGLSRNSTVRLSLR